MIAILFLFGSLLLGVGVVRKLHPFADGPERLFWGMSIGVMISTWAGYLISRLMLDINVTAILGLTILIWIAAALLSLSSIRGRLRSFSKKSIFEHKYLIVILVIFVPFFAYYLYGGMFSSDGTGLYLNAAAWYDAALHLAISNSFAFGQNFPPLYLIIPDEPLRYPFMPDFHAAIFLKLGWSIWASFYVTSIVAGIALVGSLYCLAKRLAGSSGAAFIAVLLFLLNGGFGFYFFFEDWYLGDRSLWANFFDPKENYTDIWSSGIRWVNVITSGIVPQRAMLYGMPIAFLVLALFAKVWKDWADDNDEDRWDGSLTLAIAGIVTGLMPLFHVHSYMAVGLISGFLFLIRPRFAWIAYWVPAVVLALPQVLSSGSKLPTETFFKFHFGWMSFVSDNFLVFVVMNFGLPLILLVPALFKVKGYVRTFYLAFGALIVFCFLFRISPNDFDNIKLMYYWHAATAIVVAIWLKELFSRPILRPVGAALIVICTFSGILAVVRETNFLQKVVTNDEVEAGDFARDHTSPNAVFVTGQYHNQPALCFGGRQILLGYEFWVISHGYAQRLYDAQRNIVMQIYRGGPAAETLMAQNGVDYVYVGPHELKELAANQTYFDRHHDAVFRNETIKIYKVRK